MRIVNVSRSSSTASWTYPQGDAEEWIRLYAADIERVEQGEVIDRPCITFVIVGYRTPVDIISCVRRCCDQAHEVGPVEVVVVDNTGLEDVIDELRPLVTRLIRMKRNVGPSPARNLAAAYARAPLVAFIDDDGWIEPGWANAALNVLADDRVLAVRGKIVFKRHPWYTALAKHYDLGSHPLDDLLSTEGNCVVKRSEYIRVGGFAHELMGGEGLELAWRWRQAYPDRVIRYEPGMVMRHDYYNSWAKMRVKTLRYASVDENWATGSTPIGRYRREFHARRRPGYPDLSADQWVARSVLKLVQAWIRLTHRRLR